MVILLGGYIYLASIFLAMYSGLFWILEIE